eukprot:TRINITY_DN7052_c0_g1_i1.p1 TRINITY_DN7052_c0_g1~~TRINITY_DN7052_c0_g1_i1.p1  ORF type:complete len:852 (-),score=181.36 TRINITY_DN7052_c0_g1_i1:92-2647(-)
MARSAVRTTLCAEAARQAPPPTPTRRLRSFLCALAVSGGVGRVASAAEAASPSYVDLVMYGAGKASESETNPSNVNVYDAAGLMKYLSTEVVNEAGATPERTSRRLDVDTIFKYTVRVLNPPKEVKGHYELTQFEFGPLTNFDSTGATAQADNLAKAGDFVGVQAERKPDNGKPMGDPRFIYGSAFFTFSLPGVCPNLPTSEKDGGKADGCLSYDLPDGSLNDTKLMGGLCPHKMKNPTGKPGCTYVVKSIETKSLDELVGITSQKCNGGKPCKNWLDFHQHCDDKSMQFLAPTGTTYCREFDAAQGCEDSCFVDACNATATATSDFGIPFWKGRCRADRNGAKVDALVKLFAGSKDVETATSDQFYGTNKPCSSFSGCQTEVGKTGLQYCNRDVSGICDICYIPGAQQSPDDKPPGVDPCRVDLFQKKVQGKTEYPSSPVVCYQTCDASKECDGSGDNSLCCVYGKQCSRKAWEVSDWGSCSAKCGNGTHTRTVSCPFAQVFGNCSKDKHMDKKPNSSEFCRGTGCPWDPKHFGNWTDCNNSCGEGMETQAPVCQCAKPCMHGSAECKDSPLPTLPTRSCFTRSEKQKSELEFCDVCKVATTKASAKCSKCLEGFEEEKDGTCSNTLRYVTASWALQMEPASRLSASSAGSSSILQNSTLAWAWATSLKATLEALTGNLRVEVEHLEDDSSTFRVASTSMQKSLRNSNEMILARRLAASNSTVGAYVLVFPSKDDDAALKDALQAVGGIDDKEFADKLKTAYAKALPDSPAPAGLAVQTGQKPAAVCKNGATPQEGEICDATSSTTTEGPSGGGGVPTWVWIVGGLVVLVAVVVGLCACVARRRDGDHYE